MSNQLRKKKEKVQYKRKRSSYRNGGYCIESNGYIYGKCYLVWCDCLLACVGEVDGGRNKAASMIHTTRTHNSPVKVVSFRLLCC